MTLNWASMALVGRIARPHGNRGEVIVNPETDFPEARFRPGEILYTRREGGVEALRVRGVRFHRGRPIVGLEGVETITAAEGLANLELRIPSERLHALPAGVFYRHDLVGCQVRTVAGMELGAVTSVVSGAGPDRLVVATTGEEIEIPLVAEICVRVDPATRTIVIDPPEGLLDVNE